MFAAALLNSQPMGFYAPAQIVRDAREHDVEVRHPDVNASAWDCTLEPRPRRRRRALRLGFRQIDGFREVWAQALVAARVVQGPFSTLDSLRTRAGLPPQAIDSLAAADALGSLDLGRRVGLWAAKGLPRSAAAAPLFAAAGIDLSDGDLTAPLEPLRPAEEVVADYETLRLSLKAHPMHFLRARMAQAGALTAQAIGRAGEGARVAAAGVVLVRQRPGSAKGVVFLTIEDETGVVNIVVWPKVFARERPLVMGARLVLVRGRIQRSDGVTHLVADGFEDRTRDLDLLADGRLDPPRTPGDEARPLRPESTRHAHPRDLRVLPRSRDFH